MNKKVIILFFAIALFLCSSVSANFTIIALPDTQKYSASYPAIFTAQTQWIADNKDGMNIVFVTHEGDIVDTYNSAAQWSNAKTSMNLLNVPYGIAPGNHDISSQRDTTFFNQYFPVGRVSTNNYPHGKRDNTYQLFSADGADYIIFHLAFCPTEDVLQWANNVLQQNSNRQAIITTHGFLNADAERNIHAPSGSCIALINNTQYIWDELIYPNENVFLVLSGHVHAEARRTDPNIAGKPVYQLLADYQDLANGGDGWLRILEFSGDNVYVQTYSPYLNSYKSGSSSEFILSLPADKNNQTIGIIIVVTLLLIVTYYYFKKRKKKNYFKRVLRLG